MEKCDLVELARALLVMVQALQMFVQMQQVMVQALGKLQVELVV